MVAVVVVSTADMTYLVIAAAVAAILLLLSGCIPLSFASQSFYMSVMITIPG